MKSVEMKAFGDIDVLEIVDKKIPIVNNYDVRVKLHFAGVNAAETYIRQGGYAFFKPELPYTPGFDGAGVIEEVGREVTDLKVGDRVFIASALSKKATGTYAEEIVVSADGVRKLSDNNSFEEGAALGIPATAAYRALFQRGDLKSNERVLIHGASGGVGTLAVQMAKAHGAYVIGTAGTKEGMRKVKENGADIVLNHRSDNYLEEIKSVDLVIEMLANVNLEKDLSVLNQRGRIIIVGNRGELTFNPRLTMEKEADIRGIAVWNATKDENEESLNEIQSMLEKGELHPEIGSIYSIENVREAQDDLVNQPSKGKMLLKI
ncbi:NADPH:quinone reductase [Vagococcus carniphilus]|uniref:NADPH:quinone reductase n=1 Tax=Vagococcus carniphilus TaxID=218144 RepID=UPI0028922AFB|nr:NADPH:quinone reductase [Vagococcus carniphilus]MDT2847728.1 NADPH:quinone reductase [Vagococcus carniphilus]